jgi:hypothetical protein
MIDKNVLIEVFKNKSCSDDATPETYGDGAFSFWTGENMTKLVDVRIQTKLLQHYITYENVSFEITSNEYIELLEIHKSKYTEQMKKEAEIEKKIYNENIKDLLEIYNKSICNKREILFEKTQND